MGDSVMLDYDADIGSAELMDISRVREAEVDLIKDDPMTPVESLQPPSQVALPVKPPLSLQPQVFNDFNSTNHIWARSSHSPRTPRAPRAYSYRPHHYGASYSEWDDPKRTARYRPQVQESGALDYDESPTQEDASQGFIASSSSATSFTSSSPITRSPPRGPRSYQPQYTREILQYEAPVARQYEEFEGYDDIEDKVKLNVLWYQISHNFRRVNNLTCLVSYYEEEHFVHYTKQNDIEVQRERLDFRAGRLRRPIDKPGTRSASWDKQKARNGYKFERDSYIGPGPEHEVGDLGESIGSARLTSPPPSSSPADSAIEDEEMDGSPYNERRRDNRRGGGRHSYGGGGNRKRGREDDDDQRDYVKKQRPRYEEPIASRIRRDIIFIGEEALNSTPQDHCAAFGRDIANNFEDDQVRGPLLDTLVAMLVEQPLKIPFVAAAALYANDLNAEVTKELLARTSKKMAYALELGNWRDFKLLLRFHACLQGVLEGPGVFQILNQLFDWVIDLQSSSAEDALGLELTKIILLTIPYALAASPEAQNTLGDLLDKTEIVAGEAGNHPLASLVDPYPIDGEEKPFGYQSVVQLLQQQLREEASKGWEFKCIARPYVPIKAVTESENGVVKETPKHALPALTVPMPVDITKKPLVPETFFTMFAEQDIHTTPAMNDISLSLIRDTMADTISILHYNRIAVATFLTQVDQFWAPGTFVTRGITLDQLRNYPPERSKWKIEDMFIDSVFSQQLVLPEADQKLVYYHSIIFEACKLAPSAVAPTLGRGIRWLFRHVDDLDLELVYRLLDWFAHHLSNFEFRWKWTEWIGELDRSDLSPKKAFIIAALDKEVRLSFAKRIRDTLPEPYYALLSEGKFKDIPPFKYDNPDTPFASEGKEIYKLMKAKAPEEQIQPFIDAIQEQAASLGLDPLLASTDVYMTAMCHNGAKSVSHITAAMDRSKTRLQEARMASSGVGRQIVEAVVTYWKDQPGNAVNIVDKLLNYTIIVPDSVIEWALGPDSLANGAVLSQAWRYEVVAKTMAKVTARVQDIAEAKVKLVTENEYAPTETLQTNISQVNDILNAELPAMRQLFATIEDAVAGVASGSADGFLENSQSDEDAALIKAWGEKWLRAFRRKLAIIEAHVSEIAVEAQLVSAKEQFKLNKEREARQKAEDDAARAKEQAEREARIAKEEAERAEREAAAAEAAAKETNGDTAMDGANGHADNDDLDVAE